MADEAEVLTIQEVGRRGGLMRAQNLTADQRRDIARRAAAARWAKKAKPPEPPDPHGPHRDVQGAEAGIMLSARRAPKSCRKSLSPSRKASAFVASLFELEGRDAA